MTFTAKINRLYRYIWLTVATLILLVPAGCGSNYKEEIATVKVEKDKFEIIIPAFGELEAVKSTPIAVPSQVKGRQTIAWMLPENSLVKKGETVIRLDANVYNEQIQEEEFSIAKLNLQIKDKEQELGKERDQLTGELNLTTIEKEMADLYAARDETLYAKNKIIEDAINLEYLQTKTKHFQRKKDKLAEKSRAELQLLQLQRKTHQVKLDQYKEALDSLEIKAPHDGLFVLVKNWRGEKPRLGQSVWSGRKIGKLPDLSQMEAQIYILESEASGLKKDLPVTVILDSRPELKFAGKVSSIDTIAKPLEQESPLKYFQIKVSLEKTDSAIMKPGNQVKATVFVQQIDEAISVPNQALFFQMEKDVEKTYVNVKTSSGYKQREVKTGVRSLTRTVVTEGLEEGEEILLGKPENEE